MKCSSLYPPGALPARAAYEYAGGRVVFEALREAFPELVRPVYESQRLTVYRREGIDQALAAAALQRTPLASLARSGGSSSGTTQHSDGE